MHSPQLCSHKACTLCNSVQDALQSLDIINLLAVRLAGVEVVLLQVARRKRPRTFSGAIVAALNKIEFRGSVLSGLVV